MYHFTFDWTQTLSMLSRVALAALLSGVIGYEREHVQRNAGMRTHILVAIGAALVILLLWLGFNQVQSYILSLTPTATPTPKPLHRPVPGPPLPLPSRCLSVTGDF